MCVSCLSWRLWVQLVDRPTAPIAPFTFLDQRHFKRESATGIAQYVTIFQYLILRLMLSVERTKAFLPGAQLGAQRINADHLYTAGMPR